MIRSFIKSRVFLIIGLIFIVFCSYYFPGEGSGNGVSEAMIAYLVYFWLFLALLKIKGGKNDFIWQLLCVIFWLKVSLVLINYSIPMFPPAQDALQNSGAALQLSSAWRGGQFILSIPENVERAYVLVMAIIYFIFGYNLYLGCLFNILAATAAIYFVYKIAFLLFGPREAIVASISYALMPYLNFMSFFFNREIIIIFLYRY